ncbi:hypothetical protein DKM44_09685 [Deinococcus irradiatisoli]|uniref:Uncharacterized protein n=2 Tax=Deinococcus irradiatisoli TaxID=2202254 RepID=A0A2Z3JE72_9DEIO|nr:hypothetical protein DKM44_09685 [Deinococcus irradiatisoli]
MAARRFSPQARHRSFVAAMWVLGLACLGLLAYGLTLPLAWQQMLILWIVLTFIADEAGNWFGYSAIPLGVLPLVLGSTPPEQWWVIFPLIATSLLVCLVVKHAGGPFVLPFAAVLFVVPILAAAKLAPYLDTSIKFPANPQFQKLAFIAAGIGLLLSLIRQSVVALVQQRARRPRPATLPASTSTQRPVPLVSLKKED